MSSEFRTQAPSGSYDIDWSGLFAGLWALAYPAHFSIAEVEESRLKLRAYLGVTEAEVEAERRRALDSPAANVTSVED